MSTLRIHLLGAPQFDLDGDPVHVGRRRALALGVYLAVTGVAHSRDALTTLFWPEAPQSEGRANLRRMLYSIVHAWGEDFVVASADQVRFHRNGNLWLDLEEFRRLVAACHRHGHGPDVVCADCLPLLTQAADLYRDDFLAGFSLSDSPDFDRWQFFQAEQARSEMSLVLELLTENHRDQGRYAQAIVYTQRRLAFDPLYEPAHRRLMQLYAWTEQPAAALRQYQLCTRLLAQELGVPPAPDTEELHQSILDRRERAPTPAKMVLPLRQQSSLDDVRLITVVSAGLADDDDETDLSERAERVLKLVGCAEALARSYGGHAERVLGEDVHILFGRDQIHEDDAERGVRAALDLQQQCADSSLAVRIGANTGMAYCRRIDANAVSVTGGAVSLATRLRNRAPAGGVVVGRATYQVTRGLCDYLPTQLSLPGVSGEVEAYVVARRRATPMKQRGIEGLSAQLIGRTVDMGILYAVLTKAVAGEGQAVAIVGPAGVGKSRLVRELRLAVSAADDPAAERMLWLEGRGVEHAMGTAYSLFADLLRAHFAEAGGGYDSAALAGNVVAALDKLTADGTLAASERDAIGPALGWLLSLRFGTSWDSAAEEVDAGWMRRRTFSAIQTYLAALARRRPLILVLEDLHWADAHSLALASAMMDILPGRQLLLVGLYRPEAMQSAGDFAAQARAKAPDRFTEIVLQDLSPLHSRQMLASLLAIERLPQDTREAILARGQGNPLFLEELVRDLIDSGVIVRSGNRWIGSSHGPPAPVPETIYSVALSRADRLDEGPRLALQAASVFGRIFRPALLAKILPDAVNTCDAIATLTAQGFVYEERVDSELEYSFVHVLVRDAVYQAMPKQQRAELHRRAARAIEERYYADLAPHVEELAYHFDAGESPRKAVEYLLKAGRKAQSAYLNEEAIAFYRRALARLDDSSQNTAAADRLAALRGIGEVYATLGNLDEAEPPLRRAIELAQTMGFPAAEQAKLLFPLCHLLRFLGRSEELWRLAQEGLALLDRVESGKPGYTEPEKKYVLERIMLTTFLAAAAHNMGHRNQYRALTGPVVEDLRSLGYDPRLMAAYGMAALWYRDNKQVAEGLTWIESLQAEARRRNDLWTQGNLLRIPGYWLPEAVGDRSTVVSNLQEVLDIAHRAGDEISRGFGLSFMGFIECVGGNLAEAEAMEREALAIHERSHAPLMRVLNRKAIGWVRLCLGDWDGVVDVLERGLAEADEYRIRVHGVQMSRMTLAHAYRKLGRLSDAAALYRQVAVEVTADGDGQAWAAYALAGLEQTLDDPAVFRMACDEIARQRPSVDPLPLFQWTLEPATMDAKMSLTTSVLPHLPGATHEWAWRDLYGDCSCTVDDAGTAVYASNYFRDLWFNNVSAPRLERPVQGDFTVQVVCSAAEEGRPAIGGLVLWSDDRNFLRLGWGAHGTHTLDMMASLAGRDVYLGRGRLPSEGRMHLRLERCHVAIRALCSADGRQWYTVGRLLLARNDPLNADRTEIGVFAGGSIQPWAYPGTYAHGSAIRFTAFDLHRL